MAVPSQLLPASCCALSPQPVRLAGTRSPQQGLPKLQHSHHGCGAHRHLEPGPRATREGDAARPGPFQAPCCVPVALAQHESSMVLLGPFGAWGHALSTTAVCPDLAALAKPSPPCVPGPLLSTALLGLSLGLFSLVKFQRSLEPRPSLPSSRLQTPIALARHWVRPTLLGLLDSQEIMQPDPSRMLSPAWAVLHSAAHSDPTPAPPLCPAAQPHLLPMLSLPQISSPC